MLTQCFHDIFVIYFSMDPFQKPPHENIKENLSAISEICFLIAIFRFGAISRVMETRLVIVCFSSCVCSVTESHCWSTYTATHSRPRTHCVNKKANLYVYNFLCGRALYCDCKRLGGAGPTATTRALRKASRVVITSS